METAWHRIRRLRMCGLSHEPVVTVPSRPHLTINLKDVVETILVNELEQVFSDRSLAKIAENRLTV